MSAYHRRAARARERRADLATGVDTESGLRGDVYAQKSTRIQKAKRKEGLQSVRDSGRTTIRSVKGEPINAPNVRTEKIMIKKGKRS